MQDRSIERMIGARIRQFRKALNLKLEEVAGAAQVSTALLSKIENGKVSSPISTYVKIANALDVGFDDLVGGQPEVGALVVRKDEGKAITHDKSDHGYSFQSLGNKWSNKSLNPFVLTYEPQSEDIAPPRFTFDGEEFIYIISGKLDFFHGANQYHLDEGDSIFINGAVPHGGRASGGRECVALLISMPIK